MREPEWNAENINRKKGDTTFSQCGWCEYASCGSVRYGCYLETSCSLLKDYGLGKEVKWDTPCIVKKLGKEDFQSVLASKKYEIESKQEVIKDILNEIKVIKGLKLKAKPPLPDNRVSGFKIGETLYIFHEGKWNRGVCVSGYRSGDGCVSYVLEDYPDSKGGWGCGVSVPCVLKKWEYDYFKNNPEEFKEWLALCDHEYNGKKLNLKEYEFAMQGV